MKFLLKFIPAGALLPFFAFAQDPNLTYFGNSGTRLLDLIQGTLIPLVFSIAVLVFLWGMFTAFILGGGDEEKQSKGKQLMIYAIVGFVLMVALWGIVALVLNVFGLGQGGGPNIPDSVPRN